MYPNQSSDFNLNRSSSINMQLGSFIQLVNNQDDLSSDQKDQIQKYNDPIQQKGVKIFDGVQVMSREISKEDQKIQSFSEESEKESETDNEKNNSFPLLVNSRFRKFKYPFIRKGYEEMTEDLENTRVFQFNGIVIIRKKGIIDNMPQKDISELCLNVILEVLDQEETSKIDTPFRINSIDWYKSPQGVDIKFSLSVCIQFQRNPMLGKSQNENLIEKEVKYELREGINYYKQNFISNKLQIPKEKPKNLKQHSSPKLKANHEVIIIGDIQIGDIQEEKIQQKIQVNPTQQKLIEFNFQEEVQDKGRDQRSGAWIFFKLQKKKKELANNFNIIQLLKKHKYLKKYLVKSKEDMKIYSLVEYSLDETSLSEEIKEEWKRVFIGFLNLVPSDDQFNYVANELIFLLYQRDIAKNRSPNQINLKDFWVEGYPEYFEQDKNHSSIVQLMLDNNLLQIKIFFLFEDANIMLWDQKQRLNSIANCFQDDHQTNNVVKAQPYLLSSLAHLLKYEGLLIKLLFPEVQIKEFQANQQAYFGQIKDFIQISVYQIYMIIHEMHETYQRYCIPMDLNFLQWSKLRIQGCYFIKIKLTFYGRISKHKKFEVDDLKSFSIFTQQFMDDIFKALLFTEKQIIEFRQENMKEDLELIQLLENTKSTKQIIINHEDQIFEQWVRSINREILNTIMRE